MEVALYFAILCLIYAVSELAVERWVPMEYWFMSGWIIGIIIAMAYKAVVDNVKDENKSND